MKFTKSLRRLSLTLLFALSFIQLFPAYYVYVQFKDKKGTPYTLNRPSDYLTAKSIARRNFFKISIDSTDLPINPTYISLVENIVGSGTIACSSKWTNGITVLVPDSSLMSQVRALNCVKFTQYTGIRQIDMAIPQAAPAATNLTYGLAAPQISTINGKALHQAGYTGSGINIAVLDAGFFAADINPAFETMRTEGRLLGTLNIADPAVSVYNDDQHGSNVLSIMGGEISGSFTGTAPKANYLLVETEYVATEYLVETDFWTSGLEYADSLGMDVVNSSLSYTTFDDSKMDFKYSDMNGKTSRASRAATLASHKGMIICISAGNSGDKTWKYIGSPADAADVLTVGSIKADSTISAFSSYGPTADGRVKPDICAIGSSTYYVDNTGTIAYGSGTSYASPVIAGMMACLLQYSKEKYPNKSIQDLLYAVRHSGNKIASPDDHYGYGIANFVKAADLVRTDLIASETGKTNLELWYDRALQTLTIATDFQSDNNILRIFNSLGQIVSEQNISAENPAVNTGQLSGGLYIITLQKGNQIFKGKIIL